MLNYGKKNNTLNCGCGYVDLYGRRHSKLWLWCCCRDLLNFYCVNSNL